MHSGVHKLRFKIDSDAPAECMVRWAAFKQQCENGNNRHIAQQMVLNCELEQNARLPWLDRKEGGLGGNVNAIHKQVRFRDYRLWSKLPRYCDNDIVFDRIDSTAAETWTYAELDDLVRAFVKTASRHVGAQIVDGCIEITPESSDI